MTRVPQLIWIDACIPAPAHCWRISAAQRPIFEATAGAALDAALEALHPTPGEQIMIYYRAAPRR